jgi:hypothetical protein
MPRRIETMKLRVNYPGYLSPLSTYVPLSEPGSFSIKAVLPALCGVLVADWLPR